MMSKLNTAFFFGNKKHKRNFCLFTETFIHNETMSK